MGEGKESSESLKPDMGIHVSSRDGVEGQREQEGVLTGKLSTADFGPREVRTHKHISWRFHTLR